MASSLFWLLLRHDPDAELSQLGLLEPDFDAKDLKHLPAGVQDGLATLQSGVYQTTVAGWPTPPWP